MNLNVLRESISGLGRVFACGLSGLLPRVRRSFPQEWRDLGNAVHEFLRRVPEVGAEQALAEAPERFRGYLETIDLARTPAAVSDGWAREVAFAWDWMEGKAWEIGRNIDRAYPEDFRDGPTVIYGTADVVGLIADRVNVGDYKSGWGHLVPARDSWQLAGYAIAGSLAYHRDAATVSHIRLRNGDPWWDSADLDEMDLAGRAEQVRDTLGPLLTADVHSLEPHEGEWCSYCPCFDACPAKQQLARQLATIEPADVGAITTDNAAKVWSLICRGRRVLDAVEARVQDFARGEPFELPGGELFGPHRKKLTDEVDETVAGVVLRQRYGDEQGSALAAAAIKNEPKWVKGRLQAAITGVARERGTSVKSEVDAVYELLRQAGTARPVMSQVICSPYKPPKEKKSKK